MDSDTDAVVDLWRACGLTVAWNDPYKDILRKRHVGPEFFLVAEATHRIVGTVMGGYDGHRGNVNYLGVLPDVRGDGVGRQLMDAVEVLLMAAGCPKINLCVRATNIGAIGFYETLGYSRDSVVLLGKRLIPDILDVPSGI
ncbi:MAG: hypothetical protein AMXMBFR84_36770 [Candidatus Hydrogenedentota bacterium]